MIAPGLLPAQCAAWYVPCHCGTWLSCPAQYYLVVPRTCYVPDHCFTCGLTHTPDEWLARKLWLVKAGGWRKHKGIGGQLAAQVALRGVHCVVLGVPAATTEGSGDDIKQGKHQGSAT